MKKKIMVSLSWKSLELIARYYRFPTTVFLLSEKDLKKQLKRERGEKIKEAVEKNRVKRTGVGRL